MKMITIEQYNQLIKNGSPENRDKDHFPVVKLFLTGTACTWLLTEISPDEPTIAFGLCDLGMGFPELGDVSLTELSSVRNHLGLGVERDTSFEARYPLSVYTAASKIVDAITENNEILEQAAKK